MQNENRHKITNAALWLMFRFTYLKLWLGLRRNTAAVLTLLVWFKHSVRADNNTAGDSSKVGNNTVHNVELT